ncbi:MAG: GAF domain-containing protein [Minicystis sp.]
MGDEDGAEPFSDAGEMDPRAAMEAIRLAREEARRASDYATCLWAVAEALSTATTLEEAAQVAVEQITLALGARGGAVSILNPDPRVLRLVAFHGVPAERFDRVQEIPLATRLPVVDAVIHRRPFLYGNLASFAAAYPEVAVTLDPQYQAWAAVPLLVEDRALGGAWFLFDEPRAFTRDDEAMMMTISRQAAQAIARSLLFEAERRARARAERVLSLTRRLEEVTRIVSRSMSAEAAAQAVLEAAASALSADATMLHRLREDGAALDLVRSVGLKPDDTARYASISMTTESPITEATRLRQPIWLPDREAYARAFPESATRFSMLDPGGGATVASLPLVVEGRVLGAMAILFYKDRGIDEDERRFMLLLADHCALALARVALYASEREARRIAEEALAAARDSERRKDEFLAILGHELRNPLAPILTALELMRLRGGDAHQRERVVIERQVRHLTRLVEDLLDVSRITRGKVALKIERLEIAEVVKKAIELSSPLLEQKLQELSADVPASGLAVDGDHVRLAQIVTNLLTNAGKYTEERGRVLITARREEGEVVLRVRDTGIGIAPELLPHIFDMFIQAPQTIERSQGGLGLGLTIVKQLAELHGGAVEARSGGIGQGSEFIVRLPAAAGAAVAATDEVHSTRPRATGFRVLVVDDNRDAAELIADAIAELGHRTELGLRRSLRGGGRAPLPPRHRAPRHRPPGPRRLRGRAPPAPRAGHAAAQAHRHHRLRRGSRRPEQPRRRLRRAPGEAGGSGDAPPHHRAGHAGVGALGNEGWLDAGAREGRLQHEIHRISA